MSNAIKYRGIPVNGFGGTRTGRSFRRPDSKPHTQIYLLDPTPEYTPPHGIEAAFPRPDAAALRDLGIGAATVYLSEIYEDVVPTDLAFAQTAPEVASPAGFAAMYNTVQVNQGEY